MDSAIRTLHLSIDHALAISYRRNPYDATSLYVGHISLVKGVPFYGYKVGYRFFFKIYLLSPLYTVRLADLLRQGAVMKRVLQPYESHMQFIPQWMCDYNLYGCGYLKCDRVKFRQPIPSYSQVDLLDHHWHDETIPPEMISDNALFPKQSHCALEVDIHVRDILNRHEVRERPLHHDFVERLYAAPPDEKLVPSLAGLWEDEKRRRKAKLKIEDPAGRPFSPDDLVSMSADPRRTGPGGWAHEEEFREHIKRIIAEEDSKEGQDKPTFDGFVRHPPNEHAIKSALSSVEDLFPENLHAEHTERQRLESFEERRADVDVDESLIRSPQLDDGSSTEDEMDDSFYQAFNELENYGENEPDQPDDNTNIPVGSLGPASNIRKEKEQANTSESEQCLDPRDFQSHSVRKPSELVESGKDLFEIGDEFISQLKPKAGKHPRPARAESPKKRLKSLNNANVSASYHDDDQINGERVPSQPMSSQKPMLKDDGSDQRISFPVVKDPNDPATILRHSQQSKSSKLPSQDPEKSIRSPHQSGGNDRSASPEREVSQQLRSQEPQPCSRLRGDFTILQDGPIYYFALQCPSRDDVRRTINDGYRPSAVYQKAFYSDDRDVPDRPREYAGREFRLESNTLPFLPPFDPTGNSPAMAGRRLPIVLDRSKLDKEDDILRKGCSLRTWEFAPTLPSRAEVVDWTHKNRPRTDSTIRRDITAKKDSAIGLSQIDGPTQKDRHGFKYSQKKASKSVKHEANYMSVISLEVHVNTRGTLAPNPEEDEVSCVFWCIQTHHGGLEGDDDNNNNNFHAGIVVNSREHNIADKVARGLDVEFEEETTEIDLITRLMDIVRHHDPDILTGYEVHNSSWGYLIERARHKFDYDLCDELSRVRTQSHGRFGKENDRWGFNRTSTIRVTGRHMINIWRAMRGELNLLQYTMENVAFHLLHRRIPHYPFQDLTNWFKSDKPRDVAKVMNYFISRVKLDLKILEANELIVRTSEQARILGIDFFSVFSRGSQFKVESLMFRIAKPENFILISPGRKQVGQQNALECLPLVMEPQSDFYTSPLLVLDFQSLYPSIMVAYNYCYSTYLGRIVDWRGRNKMGVIDYQRQEGLMSLLRDHINIAPNGIMYTKPDIRKSLLAKMLTEILETRVMVKSGMKAEKDDRVLQKLLNNRQLALKLISNVTYGYTSAAFSGRMPCSEIADSIVQTARETLEKAIVLIHSVERWGAEVVYGDTDSLFIYLKGKTRDEAFDIGEDIARTITDANPRPIKLKFEKVYHPSVLLAKKRYVGYMYENRNQKEPRFDAKGIETVRRDGTPAEQKIEEKALKILFETADLSRVKRYFQDQCFKIMQGKVSIQDFCFAKEVRLGTYSDKGQPPPGALISARRMLEDPRLEPQYGERVPYVVVSGAPGSRIIDRSVAPEVLLEDPNMELDAEYYISKNLIPPLERIFNLVGANVRQWYDEMPKYQRMRRIEGAAVPSGKDAMPLKKTLESYMKSLSCILCREKFAGEHPICPRCLEEPHKSLLRLKYRTAVAEKKVLDVHRVCKSCMGIAWDEEVKCDSKACPVFYTRKKQDSDARSKRAFLEPVAKMLEERSERDEVQDAEAEEKQRAVAGSLSW